MNWKNWKLGLFVAVITGFFTCLTVGAVVPSATAWQLVLLFGAFVGKDVLLYLKSNPAEKVVFDSVTTRTGPAGESVTTIHATSPAVNATQPPVDPAQPKTP